MGYDNTSENKAVTFTTSEGKNTRTYTLHKIVLPASESAHEAVISCILSPDLIRLLPNPIPCATKPYDNPNVQVMQTAHKGAGIFALSDIPAGEVIIVEHPVLILPTGKFPQTIYDELGAQLPHASRVELMSMANARSREECPSHVEGIVRTNALVLELDPRGRLSEGEREVFGGVYPHINRANHSCGPNVAVKWDLSSFTTTLYALRPISAGEEIVKTYINPALSREFRLDILEKNYRFICDCRWCNIQQSFSKRQLKSSFSLREVERIAASDRNRELLGTWIFTRPGYKKWSKDLARDDNLVIASHLEALELIEKEGMHGLQNLFVEEIAMSYSMLGNLDAFKQWGSKVVQLSKVDDPATARKFEEWLVDPPKKVKQWAWRKKQREYATSQKPSRCNQDVDVLDIFSDLLELSV